jgi:hypothetical protein
MTRFLRDLALGIRLLLKSPGFGFVAGTALAVGLGANITIFSFVNATLLRPLDASEPDRLIRAYGGGSDPRATVEYRDYLKYRDDNQSLSSLAMFHWGGLMPVRIEGAPQMIHVMPVTGNYFDALGIRSAMGRTLKPEDDLPGAARVVMLSDACWRQHFAADHEVVGQVIFIKRVPLTIIGVTPALFRGTIGAPVVPQFYVPWNESYGLGSLKEGHLIGRLKAGVSRTQAQADLSTIAARITAEESRQGRCPALRWRLSGGSQTRFA